MITTNFRAKKHKPDIMSEFYAALNKCRLSNKKVKYISHDIDNLPSLIKIAEDANIEVDVDIISMTLTAGEIRNEPDTIEDKIEKEDDTKHIDELLAEQVRPHLKNYATMKEYQKAYGKWRTYQKKKNCNNIVKGLLKL